MKQELDTNNLTGKQFKELCEEKGIDIGYAEDYIDDDEVSSDFGFLTRNLHRDWVDFPDEYDYDLLMTDLVNICRLMPGTFEELKNHLENN